MTKYHVEYDLDAGTSSEYDIRRYLEEEVDAENLALTEIKPKAESGWYRTNGHKDVIYWEAQEIQEYWGDGFLDDHTRMKEPEVWSEEKYKDGYYRMSDGYLYRRTGGVWYLYLPSVGGWDTSSCNDDTIEEDFTVQYLGVHQP